MEDKKIKCQECGWSWKLSEGGKDPYVCHKCGHDNTSKYVMEISISKEDLDYVNECLSSGEVLEEDLGRWFKEKWVDVSKKVHGKHPPCGRKKASDKSYPKCRPLKKVSKETPKTASSYTKKEKKAMTTQKRKAEKTHSKSGTGNKPVMAKYDESVNDITMSEKNSAPKLKTLSESNVSLSSSLLYHIINEKPLTENVFRIYSDKFFELFNESRSLHEKGQLEVYGDDLELINTDLGKTGIYEGEEVYLDIPFILDEEEHLLEVKHRGKNVKLNHPFRTPGGPKKFGVYVKNKSGNVIKVTFGDPNLRVRNSNPKAAKSFRARHHCEQKKDRTTAGYWSCHIARYRKALGIKSSNPW